MSGSLVYALAPESQHGVVVHLYGGPYVSINGLRAEVPERSKRLLAFLSLNGGRIERRRAAGALWPESDESRAAGSLRSALWRLREAQLDVLDCDRVTLGLRAGILIDVCVVCAWAKRVIDGTAGTSDLVATDVSGQVLDLLPGWYDDWVIYERERLRQRLIHALEALSRRLLLEGRFADAIEAAMRALAADPLRESAVRALLEAHLAEGNISVARRMYDGFVETLIGELGVQPSAELRALVSQSRASVPAGR